MHAAKAPHTAGSLTICCCIYSITWRTACCAAITASPDVARSPPALVPHALGIGALALEPGTVAGAPAVEPAGRPATAQALSTASGRGFGFGGPAPDDQ